MEHGLPGSQGWKQWGQHNKTYPPRSRIKYPQGPFETWGRGLGGMQSWSLWSGERSKHPFCWWGPPGEKPLMLSSCSATSPSHPQQRAAVSYLLPDTKCAKMIFMNLPSLHMPLLPYSFSLFSTIPLSMFSFLSPPLPHTRFQFEATAGNIAISGGRPGVAAPVSEAAQECATVTSS